MDYIASFLPPPSQYLKRGKSENFVSGNLIIAWASKQPEKAAELQLAIVPVVTVLPPTELSNFRPRSLKIHSKRARIKETAVTAEALLLVVPMICGVKAICCNNSW